MSEMEVSKSETCLWKIVLALWNWNTFTQCNSKSNSDCYALYTTLSQVCSVFDLLLFRSTRPFSTDIHYGVSVMGVDYSILTMTCVNCIHNISAREIEFIMRVRVRLCLNACVLTQNAWELGALLPWACYFPDPFQSMYTLHLCLQIVC